MTTTDRMPNLNSLREATDRIGNTVVLGNAVSAGAVSAIAQIVAASVGSSRNTGDMSASSIATLTMYNGTFGIWSSFLSVIAAASLIGSGASTATGRLIGVPAALLTWGADAMLINIRVITATGTYTPTAGTAQVVVMALGGGGGGGSTPAQGAGVAASSGGGGAGAMAMGRITSGFSGVLVTVGAGGAGGASGGANAGTAGGNTSFGSVLIAGGGSGGASDSGGVVPRTAAGGVGGAASGTSSLFGSQAESGGQGYTVASHICNGEGGSSAYGCGARANNSSNGTAGQAGNGFGAGGSGASANQSTVSRVGGAGSDGMVIIYEYNA